LTLRPARCISAGAMEENQKRIAELKDNFKNALYALLEADPNSWGWALEVLYAVELPITPQKSVA
jgi:hypothetical protein